jgi:hypothetical protein
MNLFEALDMVAKDEKDLQEKYLKLADQEKVYKKYEKILNTINKKTY